jgi:hypothetical protein
MNKLLRALGQEFSIPKDSSSAEAWILVQGLADPELIPCLELLSKMIATGFITLKMYEGTTLTMDFVLKS